MTRWQGFSMMNLLTGDLRALRKDISYKIRILTSFLAILSIFSPLLGIFYLYIQAPTLPGVCFAAGVVAFLSLLGLRRFKKAEVFANLGIFVLWAVLLIIRWKTGAMSAPGPELLTWVWNTVMILLAVYLTGFLWGSIWASLVFVESGFAALLYKTGHHIDQIIPQSMAASYGLGAYLLALLTVLLIAFLFEKERRELIERDQEQAELIEGSRRYVENLLSKTPVPMFVIDKNHKVIQWNRACEEMTGIAPNEILGKRVWKGFAIEEGRTFADELLEGLDNFKSKHGDKIISQSESGSFVLETYLPNFKDGGRVLVNTAPITDSDGNIKGAIQCIQRVGSVHAEGPAYISELEIIEDSPCPTYVVDKKGRISFWNSACEKRFGHSRELMEGRSPTSLVAKQSRTKFREAISSIFKGVSAVSREFKYYSVDGEPMYVRAELFPRRNENGKIVGCMVVNTDITDLKVRSAMLQRALIQNKEKLKSLTEEYNLLKRNIASFLRKKETEKETGYPGK
ncbi:MAG: hypothetical protein DRG71_05700 [Deltaproteobacteria bacterium]|nr:MAG: hypothetical protein DRG71_05700 [Deltaproteobacteria bacterium]